MLTVTCLVAAADIQAMPIQPVTWAVALTSRSKAARCWVLYMAAVVWVLWVTVCLPIMRFQQRMMVRHTGNMEFSNLIKSMMMELKPVDSSVAM